VNFRFRRINVFAVKLHVSFENGLDPTQCMDMGILHNCVESFQARTSPVHLLNSMILLPRRVNDPGREAETRYSNHERGHWTESQPIRPNISHNPSKNCNYSIEKSCLRERDSSPFHWKLMHSWMLVQVPRLKDGKENRGWYSTQDSPGEENIETTGKLR